MNTYAVYIIAITKQLLYSFFHTLCSVSITLNFNYKIKSSPSHHTPHIHPVPALLVVKLPLL